MPMPTSTRRCYFSMRNWKAII
ncbi:hypothetical protein Bhyg_04406 [Pseudolycoriella hygida]|uniref:Uncharacterized protein n=1 Tax=Pseudolycoriella hygida TaxID=35572 RepID=A0A9Q0NF95_9DIPT|nr:hypothetical protein Bhyg_04406 [Pseudolycoriella hygida]